MKLKRGDYVAWWSKSGDLDFIVRVVDGKSYEGEFCGEIVASFDGTYESGDIHNDWVREVQGPTDGSWKKIKPPK